MPSKSRPRRMQRRCRLPAGPCGDRRPGATAPNPCKSTWVTVSGYGAEQVSEVVAGSGGWLGASLGVGGAGPELELACRPGRQGVAEPGPGTGQVAAVQSGLRPGRPLVDADLDASDGTLPRPRAT